MASLHEQCVDAVVLALQGETVEGVDTATRVFKRALPDSSTLAYPCLLVVADGEGETTEPYDTENDERVFRVQIHLLDRRPQGSASRLWDWLQARQDVVRAFLMQLLSLTGDNDPWHVGVRLARTPESRRTLGPAFQDSRGGIVLEPRIITARRRPDEE